MKLQDDRLGQVGGNTKIIEIDREFLPKQIEVFKAIKSHKFVLYSGAVRAGKSLLLVNAAIRTCIENPGVKGFIGALTYPQLTDVMFAIFQEEAAIYQKTLDKNNIPIKLLSKIKQSSGQMEIQFWNGSIVYFKNCDDELKLRGYTLDFFMLDEPIDIDESVFTQLIARISGNVLEKPFGLLATNPGGPSHWIYQRFFKSKNPDYYTVETNTRDNVLLRDYKNYIHTLEESYDHDWINRFINGHWGDFEGQIFPNIIDHNIGKYREKSDINYYIAGIDYGSRNPTCILTIGVTKDKNAFVVDEYYNPTTSANAVKQLAELNKKYHYTKIFCDPAALDLINQAKELRLPIYAANNAVTPGINKLKSMFKKSMIKIDWHCSNLIREVPNYRYQKNRPGENTNEKPVKFDDHAIDALRYALYTFRIWHTSILAGVGKTLLWDY